MQWDLEFCTTLIKAFGHFIWQATLIGGLFVVAMNALRRSSPSARYNLGLMTLVLLALCVPVTFVYLAQDTTDTALPVAAVVTDPSPDPTLIVQNADTSVGSTLVQQADTQRGSVPAGILTSNVNAPAEAANFEIVHWSPWIMLVYLCGVAFFALRLAVGVTIGRRLRRAGEEVNDARFLSTIDRACSAVRLRSRPSILWCKRAVVPAVVGIIRPVVLLPMACRNGLTAEQLEQILIHELNHIRRFDHIVNLLQTTLEAILFFHPVVWLVSRRVRLEREFCCDAAVLKSGAPTVDYVNLLIDVAEQCRNNENAKVLLQVPATDKQSELALRVERMLGNHAGRRSTVGGASLFTILATLIAFLTLAVQKPAAADPAIPQEATAQAADDSKQAGDTTPNNAVNTEKPAAEGEIVGVVIDRDGKPIEGVLVDAWTWAPGSETRTDSRGRFRLDGQADNREKLEVRFSKQGYSPHYIVQQPTGGPSMTITLGRQTYIEGRVLDPDGKPVAGATVIGEQGAKQGDGVHISSVKTTTRSGQDGKYRMYVFHDVYEMKVAVPGSGVARISDVSVSPDEAKSLDIQLAKGVRFEANVIDADTREPVEGFVLWSWRHRNFIGKSDPRGTIVIDGMLPGEFEFNVGHGQPRKYQDMTYYDHGDLGRWWSNDAIGHDETLTLEESGWQRNFDDLTFDLSVGMPPVTIEVEKGVVFTGRVLDPNGKPVAGATVAPAHTGTGNSLTGDTRYSVTTQEDGTYRAVMPAGNTVAYNLVAHDGKYQQWRNWANGVTEPRHTSPGETIDGYDLQLEKPCSVIGKVVAKSGKPVKGLRVRAHATDLFGNRYYDPTTRTDADGNFELKFIRPGEHHIQVEPFWLSGGDAPGASSVRVRLGAGEVQEGIELQQPDEQPQFFIPAPAAP